MGNGKTTSKVHVIDMHMNRWMSGVTRTMNENLIGKLQLASIKEKTKQMSFQKYGMLRANKFKELEEGPIKPLHKAVRKDMLC